MRDYVIAVAAGVVVLAGLVLFQAGLPDEPDPEPHRSDDVEMMVCLSVGSEIMDGSLDTPEEVRAYLEEQLAKFDPADCSVAQ